MTESALASARSEDIAGIKQWIRLEVGELWRQPELQAHVAQAYILKALDRNTPTATRANIIYELSIFSNGPFGLLHRNFADCMHEIILTILQEDILDSESLKKLSAAEDEIIERKISCLPYPEIRLETFDELHALLARKPDNQKTKKQAGYFLLDAYQKPDLDSALRERAEKMYIELTNDRPPIKGKPDWLKPKDCRGPGG